MNKKQIHRYGLCLAPVCQKNDKNLFGDGLNITITEVRVKRIQIVKWIKPSPKEVSEEIKKRLMIIDSNHARFHIIADR